MTEFLQQYLKISETAAQKISNWIENNYSEDSILFNDPSTFRERIKQYGELKQKFPDFNPGFALVRWPKLIHYSVEYLEDSLWCLQNNFPMLNMEITLRRSPQLLGRDPETLINILKILSQLIGDENSDKVIGSYPQILNISQQNLFQSMNELEQIFDGRQITKLVTTKPQILLYRNFNGRLTELSTILNIHIDKVKDLVLKQPNILSISTDLIQKKYLKLKELCELEDRWKLQRSQWSNSEIGRSLTCSLVRMDRLKFLHGGIDDSTRNERSCLAWLIMSDLEFHKYYKMAEK